MTQRSTPLSQTAAILVVAAALAGTLAALLADWRLAFVLFATGLALRRKGRVGLAAFAATSLAFNAILLGVVIGFPSSTSPGSISLDAGGMAFGLELGLRLAAAVAVNFAILDWFPPAILLDGLRLPRRATALAAAGVLAAHAVGQDARRIGLAHRLARQARRDTARRDGRLAAARASVAMLPALLVAGLRRAQARRDALRLAGHATGSLFTPIVAVAALAAVGRMAFAAVPNVAPTYVVVFLGGMLFGARVGAAAAALSMVATNLVLSGLLPLPYANVPAMALLGALGGWMRRIDWQGNDRQARAAGRILAGTVGVLATMLFSIASDLATWGLAWLMHRMQGTPMPQDTVARLLLGGFAFNVLPAIINGVVFAAAVPAVARVWKAFTAPAKSLAPTVPAPTPPAP